jgi:uridylate kinase
LLLAGVIKVPVMKRTVIKLSGEALSGKTQTSPFDDAVIDAVVSQINQVVENGTEVALVVGGGNIWRGRAARPDMNQVKADNIGMLATVMNAIYLAEAFKRHNRPAKVVTPITIGEMTLRYNQDAALELMAKGTVVINAAGLGHPYFSTDTITALRAAELDADMILFAKNVDGVYDRNPSQPDAKKYRGLNYNHAIKNGLNAADIAAMHLANEARIPSFMFELAKPDSILQACCFPETAPLEGTYIDVDTKEDFYV